MRIATFIHADFEQPGYFTEYCSNAGYNLQKINVDQGEAMPKLDDFDVILSMGGPQSPRYLEQYPYLRDEIELISKAIKAEKKVLGVCLGTQLIAESYGALTEKSSAREIGMFNINLTEAGRIDPLLKYFPAELLVGHWHNDMPGLPENAAILASSKGCARQIIRFAPNVYGFQCHLELTANDIAAIYANCDKAIQTDTYVQTKEQSIQGPFEAMHQNLHNFLDRFFKHQ